MKVIIVKMIDPMIETLIKSLLSNQIIEVNIRNPIALEYIELIPRMLVKITKHPISMIIAIRRHL